MVPRFVMRPCLAALIALALAAVSPSVRAAPGDDIGSAVRVVNLVTGTFEQDHRDLNKGDPVRQDELIEVSSDGIGELRLRDDTKLALGPGARLLLDEFVYKPDIDGGAIVLNLVRGAFRFITGVAAKPAYVIQTPTAAITVRGTIFDIYIEENGRSWLLLIDGAIQACNAANTCKLLDEPGKLLLITRDGTLSDPRIWAELDTDGRTFDDTFPFVVTPPQVDPEPIFTPDDIVDASPDDEDEPGGKDDGKDDDDDRGPPPGSGPSRPDPQPPLNCWRGWKKVHRGFDEDGWRVKMRHRGDQAVYCARRVVTPPPVVVPLPPGLPVKPKCVGGKLIGLQVMPPRWSCVCPDNRKRLKVGRNSYVCLPGGGKGDPRKECLKKGWEWTGKRCIPPPKHCPKGYVGSPPHCQKIDEPPKHCPRGYIGKPPNCEKLIKLPKRCPKGYVGKPPNCEKLTHKDPKPNNNKLRDVQKTIKKLQQLQKLQKMQKLQRMPNLNQQLR